MTHSKDLNAGLLVLKKTHLAILIALGILTPLASGYTSYQSALKEISTARIDSKFADARLGLERDFLRKVDFDPIQIKINKIAEDVAEIKGYLRNR